MAHVLFVCLHNAGRSQMSHALFERIAAGRHTSDAAGSRADPSGQLHPQVIAAMAELGLDLSTRRPRLLTRDLAERADVVVTMGCGDECPYIAGKRYLDWELADPAGQSLDQVRVTREEIRRRVSALVEDLDRARTEVSRPSRSRPHPAGPGPETRSPGRSNADGEPSGRQGARKVRA